MEDHSDRAAGHEGAIHHEHDMVKPPWRPPEPALAWRGLALLGLAGAAFAGAWAAAQKSAWLGIAAGPVLTIAGVLAAWAAAIHLTGGEQFDDNPWV